MPLWTKEYSKIFCTTSFKILFNYTFNQKSEHLSTFFSPNSYVKIQQVSLFIWTPFHRSSSDKTLWYRNYKQIMTVSVLPNTHIIIKYNEIHNLILTNKDISIGITWEFLQCSDLNIILIILMFRVVSNLCATLYTTKLNE